MPGSVSGRGWRGSFSLVVFLAGVALASPAALYSVLGAPGLSLASLWGDVMERLEGVSQAQSFAIGAAAVFFAASWFWAIWFLFAVLVRRGSYEQRYLSVPVEDESVDVQPEATQSDTAEVNVPVSLSDRVDESAGDDGASVGAGVEVVGTDGGAGGISETDVPEPRDESAAGGIMSEDEDGEVSGTTGVAVSGREPVVLPARAYYFTRSGDTLRSVAAQFLNTPTRWGDLRAVNGAYPGVGDAEPDTALPVGAALALPGDPVPWGRPDAGRMWSLAEAFLFAAWGREPAPEEVAPFWRGLTNGLSSVAEPGFAAQKDIPEIATGSVQSESSAGMPDSVELSVDRSDEVTETEPAELAEMPESAAGEASVAEVEADADTDADTDAEVEADAVIESAQAESGVAATEEAAAIEPIEAIEAESDDEEALPETEVAAEEAAEEQATEFVDESTKEQAVTASADAEPGLEDAEADAEVGADAVIESAQAESGVAATEEAAAIEPIEAIEADADVPEPLPGSVPVVEVAAEEAAEEQATEFVDESTEQAAVADPAEVVSGFDSETEERAAADDSEVIEAEIDGAVEETAAEVAVSADADESLPGRADVTDEEPEVEPAPEPEAPDTEPADETELEPGAAGTEHPVTVDGPEKPDSEPAEDTAPVIEETREVPHSEPADASSQADGLMLPEPEPEPVKVPSPERTVPGITSGGVPNATGLAAAAESGESPDLGAVNGDSYPVAESGLTPEIAHIASVGEPAQQPPYGYQQAHHTGRNPSAVAAAGYGNDSAPIGTEPVFGTATPGRDQNQTALVGPDGYSHHLDRFGVSQHGGHSVPAPPLRDGNGQQPEPPQPEPPQPEPPQPEPPQPEPPQPAGLESLRPAGSEPEAEMISTPRYLPSVMGVTGIGPSPEEQIVAASRRSLIGTAVGDAMMLWQLSRLRRRGGDIATAQALGAMEESLQESAHVESLRLIEAAMRNLRAVTVGQLRERPRVLAVRTGTYGFEVLLDHPVKAPPGWKANADGYVLELSRETTVEKLDAVGHGLSLCPALVPVGDTVEGPLLLNIQEIGCLIVSGPSERSAGLLTSIASTLGASPLEGDVRVVTVGVDVPVGLGWDRVHSVSFDSPQLEELMSVAESGGGAYLDVLLVGPGNDLLIERAGRIAISSGSRLALVGATTALAGRWPWRIYLDETGAGLVHPLSVSVAAVNAKPGDLSPAVPGLARSRAPRAF